MKLKLNSNNFSTKLDFYLKEIFLSLSQDQYILIIEKFTVRFHLNLYTK